MYIFKIFQINKIFSVSFTLYVLTFQDGKKKFEKQTIKFCQSQERYLNLSTKKQDNVLQEVYLMIYETLKLYIIK